MTGGQPPEQDLDALAGRLRAAGCVFAEAEAAALARAAPSPCRREQLVRRREHGEPLEHLLGVVEFGSLRLAVGPGVFVPGSARCCWLSSRSVTPGRTAPPCCWKPARAWRPSPAPRPAPSTVWRHTPATSNRALGYVRHNLPAGTGVHLGHLLDATPTQLLGRVTVLAAVAPNVPVAAAALLPREARDHEPARALYGGRDGLDHVRELLDRARDWLAPAGRVLLEISIRQRHLTAGHAARAGLGQPRHHHGQDGQTIVLDLLAT